MVALVKPAIVAPMKKSSHLLQYIGASVATFALSVGVGLGAGEVLLSHTDDSGMLGAYILRSSSSSSLVSSKSSVRRRVRRLNRARIVKPSTRSSASGSSIAIRSSSSRTAIKATCGDKLIIRDLLEECDDGNILGGDGCSAKCLIETGFTCSGLPSICKARCGDGIVTLVEKCDDGDLDSGDGCSAACKIEFGFVCKNAPSACEPTPYCGDGVKASSEECDDGNSVPGDGCYTCQTE
jgi:cysteine-rich repeat protein